MSATDHEHPGAAVLGVDWGTSSLRAYAAAPDGCILDAVSTPHGVHTLPAAEHRTVLRRLLCPWWSRWPEAATIVSGMAGSREGFAPAPYVPTPVTVADLAAALTPARVDDAVVYVVPGVVHRTADRVDVLRGEETQIAGLLLPDPGAGRRTALLPGTHSKWIRVEDDAIVGFWTYLTGELFALLGRHSTLAAVMGEGSSAEAFTAGVAQALRARQPLRDLFGVRARVLCGDLRPEQARDWLSGLLIGAEVVEAIGNGLVGAAEEVALLGPDHLTSRYAAALRLCDVGSRTVAGDVIVHGYLALAAALTPRATRTQP
jgi:2-dehydro-3-deoxygalactonokinase